MFHATAPSAPHHKSSAVPASENGATVARLPGARIAVALAVRVFVRGVVVSVFRTVVSIGIGLCTTTVVKAAFVIAIMMVTLISRVIVIAIVFLIAPAPTLALNAGFLPSCLLQ